jgi:DNA-binding LacI/PurR family transcriptional regulator
MATPIFENQYEKVYSGITEMLRKEGYRCGDKIPPERELVERFRVSRPTVNKAVIRLVAEGVLCKESSKKGTFIASPPHNDSESRKAIGLFPGQPSNKVFKYVVPGNWGKFPIKQGVMEGIYSVGSKLGYETQLEFVSDESDWKNKIIKASSECAGLVVWGYDFELSDEVYEALNNSGIAYALVDSLPDGRDVNFVGTDNVKGASKMIDHLVSLGHKRISYITEDARKGSMRDRLTGFLQGMINNNLEILPRSVIKIDENDELSFREQIRALLTTDPKQRPTALFASHDRFIFKLCSVLNEEGVNYPEDISLAGYDDIDISAYMPIPLTTIHQDFFKMGQIATELIMECCSNKSRQRSQKIMLDPQLVIRKSTAPIETGIS